MIPLRPPLEQLEQLAQAATPGPWKKGSYQSTADSVYATDNKVVASMISACYKRPEQEANAAFIAVCSPDVILALVNRIRELEAQTSEPT